MRITVHGKPETLTPATIAATRLWFFDNAAACIADALSGVTRVNDLESYVAWREDSMADTLDGRSDRTFAFVQRAWEHQAGECIALLT